MAPLGLKMVMENFGMVMVQAPETAEFDSMPRSALATEFVDYVLPAEQLPAKLLEYVRQPAAQPAPAARSPNADAKPAHALQKIFPLIRAQTGHDFSLLQAQHRVPAHRAAHELAPDSGVYRTTCAICRKTPRRWKPCSRSC